MPNDSITFAHLALHTAVDVVTLFERLGYQPGDADPFEADGFDAFDFTTPERADLAKRDLHTVYLLETRDPRPSHLRGIAYNLLSRGTCLLVVTSDYREVAFIDPRFAGSATKSSLRLNKLKLVTGDPTRHDVDTVSALAAWNRGGIQVYDAQRDAFSVTALTRKFDRQYSDFFKAVIEAARQYNPGVREFHEPDKLRAFAQRLLGRLKFLYFLQRKGWLAGRQRFLIEQYRLCMLRHDADNTPPNIETFHYYTEVLAPLFFETMNTPPDRRTLPAWTRGWETIPYLNGGLFDPTRDPAGTILLSDALFDPMGDTGILAFLNRYNFTISEDTPLELDVAVDPEMLGKVFENQLEAQDRGQSGSFYTPRVIVAYMCQEALAGYLATRADVRRDRAQALFDAEQPTALTPAEADRISAALDTLTVLDPAVGSGSFLIGMMTEILRLRRACAFANGVAITPAQIADWKEAIIRDTLYGVDLKSEAVEVAQLRLWLALVVDQTLEQARPLPNLEYKLMVGDSLIETLDGEPILTAGSESLFAADPQALVQQNLIGAAVQSKMALFDSETAVQRSRQKFDELHRRFFRANPDERRELRAEIAIREREIALTSLGEKTDAAQQQRDALGKKSALQNGVLSTADKRKLSAVTEKLSRLTDIEAQMRDLTKPLPFFLYRLHFHAVFATRGGFDIVVVNPPYVRQEAISALKPELAKAYPEVYAGTADLYVYFYARALTLLRDGGTLAFISPNKFFRAGYGAKLRAHLATFDVQEITDFGDLPVFDTATTYPMVIILAKQPTRRKTHFTALKTWRDDLDLRAVTQATGQILPASAMNGAEWTLSDSRVAALLEKLRKAGTPLGEYVGGKMYRGILTGFNEAFAVDPKSAELIKPWLRGKDVKRWRTEPQDLFLIFARRGMRIDNYPAVKAHLEKFKDRLMPGIKGGRKAGSYQWYEVQDNIAYYAEFDKSKIVYPDIANNMRFSIDTSGAFYANTAYFLPSDDFYLLGLLNSSIAEWFYKELSDEIRGGYLRFFTQYVEQIPIPNPPDPLRAQIGPRACVPRGGERCGAVAEVGSAVERVGLCGLWVDGGGNRAGRGDGGRTECS